MKIIGKILWWDQRDQNGIIIDAAGNEFYFDISVVEGRRTSQLKCGSVVQFQINQSISNSSCAKAVIVPLAKVKGKLEREFEKNLQLSFSI